MSNRVLGLSIDRVDTARLVQFWAGVLGRPVNPHPTGELAAVVAGLVGNRNHTHTGKLIGSLLSTIPSSGRIG